MGKNEEGFGFWILDFGFWILDFSLVIDNALTIASLASLFPEIN